MLSGKYPVFKRFALPVFRYRKLQNEQRPKSLRVDAARYNRTRTGATLTLPMEKGLLGWPVIMRSMPENMPENAQKDTTVE